jgi:hypothetical protein
MGRVTEISVFTWRLGMGALQWPRTVEVIAYAV